MYLLLTWAAPTQSQRQSGPPVGEGEDLGVMFSAVGETAV